eukprot:TRINITY_DN5583_c0_g1_i1.p1 TRINITY_DN5583_c0_g1~~TRINITY_DN5583_c0_g1_i1.p1  ORF type:complete len:306 (-),score=97.20 TRINITY_DN5583_c0_g1_i1:167-1084(-)
MQVQNDPVAATNDDAVTCKMSAVERGYYEDNFIKYFVKFPRRVPPIMNRGYFYRVAAIQIMIRKFIESGGQQIISLGAGFDTTYFNLTNNNKAPELYVEIDVQTVTTAKTKIINENTQLFNLISSNANISESEILSSKYKLISVDLNNIQQFERGLNRAGVDFNKSTLFISECVLIYMDCESSDAIIAFAASRFISSAFLTYEQINPNDSFGQIMIENLAKRGCPLKSITRYPDLISQRNRYLNRGWRIAEALDMNQVSNKVLPQSLISSSSRVEMFDEFEEWLLILSHYCLVWASSGSPLPTNF